MGENSVGFSKWQNRHFLPMYAIPLIILWTGILGKFWSTFQRVLGGDIQKSERGMARMQKQERKIWLRVWKKKLQRATEDDGDGDGDGVGSSENHQTQNIYHGA